MSSLHFKCIVCCTFDKSEVQTLVWAAAEVSDENLDGLITDKLLSEPPRCLLAFLFTKISSQANLKLIFVP